MWGDDVVQRAFGGIAPFDTPVERVQLIVKSLESSMQVGALFIYIVHGDDSLGGRGRARARSPRRACRVRAPGAPAPSGRAACPLASSSAPPRAFPSHQVSTVMNKLDQAVKMTRTGKKAEAHEALDKAWAMYVGGDENCGL